ncbi:hypothetical protein QFC20_007811 [Naganishia adeliensis]|uniref:Uncharacterized protein n=1 Tax=Naganishia adeliensis TaxID=92952 RepID=A0ACC2UV21_9TREE|nr:hypothetical protein QFC20_007811 [Naganishia adeliensis]
MATLENRRIGLAFDKDLDHALVKWRILKKHLQQLHRVREQLPHVGKGSLPASSVASGSSSLHSILATLFDELAGGSMHTSDSGIPSADPDLQPFLGEDYPKTDPPENDYYSDRDWYVKAWNHVKDEILSLRKWMKWLGFADESMKLPQEDCEVLERLYNHVSAIRDYLKTNAEGEEWLDDAANAHDLQKELTARWWRRDTIWGRWQPVAKAFQEVREQFLRSNGMHRALLGRESTGDSHTLPRQSTSHLESLSPSQAPDTVDGR